MAKRKFVEELSDEELLKVVEDIQSKMVNNNDINNNKGFITVYP